MDIDWVVEVSIPLEYPDVFGFGRQMEQALSSASDCSGAGLGYRDISWTFKTEEAATEFESRIYEYLSENCISTDESDDEYSGILVNVRRSPWMFQSGD